MTAQEATKTRENPCETTENGFLELSDQELHTLIDTVARKGLGMGGEEYLYGLHEGKIERTGANGYLAHLSMLASLLED